MRQRQAVTNVVIARRKVWSLVEARTLLSRMVGEISDWVSLDIYLARYAADPQERRTMIASAFAASLEMARERKIELRQDGAFKPIFMRPGDRANELGEGSGP